MDLILLLTADTGVQIITEWLNAGDILQLDTAYCSHSTRPQFHSLISNKVIQNNKCLGFPVYGNGMRWLITRRLGVTNLQMSLGELLWKNGELAFQFLKHFAPELQGIRFNTNGFYLDQEYDYNKFLMSLTQSCPQLTHLTTGLLPKGVSTSFLRSLAANCPLLHSLSLTYFHTTADGVPCDVPFCSLRNLTVRFLGKPDTVCLPYLIVCSPQLESVSITGSAALTTEAIQALRVTTAPLHSVALFGTQIIEGVALRALKQRASRLKSITLGGRTVAAANTISDHLVVSMVQKGCLLEKLHVLCPNSLTNISLAALAADYSCLQQLTIIDNSSITDTGVKIIAKKCKYLQSVKFLECRLLTGSCFFFFAPTVSVVLSAYASPDEFSPPSSPVYSFPYSLIPANGKGTSVQW